ncbi:MAG: lactate utilization protein C [Betaproteobacteria bacterium]|nr:MAG: lactate utilization protein C [Betaproteobacteria bacterium]
MSSRERILQRIRKAQGRGGSRPSQAELEAVETYLRAHPRGTLPKVEADLVARFRARAESMQSTTEEVAAEAEVPAAVARYLKANNLPLSGCVWPQLAHFDWKGAGLALESRAANGDDPVGITGAFAAIAETGTLVLASGPDTPATVSLLPETHVAIVPAARVVAHMEDAWAIARAAFGQLPRAINFVSGPSRTADIDQQIVLGAHGPYRVHIILVRG